MTQLPPGSHDDGSDGKALIETTRSAAHDRKNGCRRDGLGSWLLLLLGGIFGYFGGVYYLSKVPLQYTATSTLQVIPRTDVGRSGGRTDASDLRDLNTMVERIRQPELLERVASRQDVRDMKGLSPQMPIDWRPEWLGVSSPTPPPSDVPSPEILQDRISGWLAVSIRPDTWLIDISITHPEPDTGHKLANFVAREYLSEVYLQQSVETTEQVERCLSVLKRSSSIDEKKAERINVQRDPSADPQELAKLDAEIKKLEEAFLAEVAGSLAALGRDSYSPAIRENLAELALDSDARLPVARVALTARIAELEWESDKRVSKSEFFNVQMSSFARTPGPPSSPDRTQALVLGTLCGLLLFLLPVGLLRN